MEMEIRDSVLQLSWKKLVLYAWRNHLMSPESHLFMFQIVELLGLSSPEKLTFKDSKIIFIVQCWSTILLIVYFYWIPYWKHQEIANALNSIENWLWKSQCIIRFITLLALTKNLWKSKHASTIRSITLCRNVN